VLEEGNVHEEEIAIGKEKVNELFSNQKTSTVIAEPVHVISRKF